MFGLQEMFNKQLKRHLEPSGFILKIIKDKLLVLGVHLNRSQLKTLRHQLKVTDPTITIELSDLQVARANINSRPELEEAIGLALAGLSSEAIEKIEKFDNTLSDIIVDTAEHAGELIFRRLRRTYRYGLKDRRDIQACFEEDTFFVWGRAINQLEVLLGLAIEAAEHIEQALLAEKAVYSEAKWAVLSRLHGRACQITGEIICLLKAGYADGAQARWRSLHEISVVSAFIFEHEDKVAEQYMQHDIIEEHKEVLQQLSHCPELNKDSSYLCELEVERTHLIEKYGKHFTGDYGWACNALGGQKPSFRQIEKHVNLSYLRPAYRDASHNVHAGVRGTFIRLGIYSESEMILAGASDYGLATPGHLTAVSLLEATIKLLQGVELIDSAVVMNVIAKQVAVTQKEFWVLRRFKWVDRITC